jgi:hypothetical protein
MSQDEYIAILFADCGYESSSQRKAWIHLRFGSPYNYADDLTTAQKCMAIDWLKGEKEGKSGKTASD